MTSFLKGISKYLASILRTAIGSPTGPVPSRCGKLPSSPNLPYQSSKASCCFSTATIAVLLSCQSGSTSSASIWSGAKSLVSGLTTKTCGTSTGRVVPFFETNLAGIFPCTVNFNGPRSSSPGLQPAMLELLTNHGPHFESKSCSPG